VASDRPAPRQARILLVDDRIENLIALDAILSPLNQILVPVRSGEQALRALLTEDFAVVLLDIVMPGMDGFETAAQIKQHARIRDVPIIFLTAATGPPEQAFRSYAAGAVDYLAKPFDPWVLKSKVSVFVDLYLQCRHSEAQTGPDERPLLLQQVSRRLRDVEEAVAVLRGLPAVTSDAQAEQAAARLTQRIGRLRDAVDAFGAGAGAGAGAAAVGDGGRREAGDGGRGDGGRGEAGDG
jgi:CheY-like chemotaxis protein